MAGKQHRKLRMVMSGRCHRGKKISCSKNLSAALHSTSSRLRRMSKHNFLLRLQIASFIKTHIVGRQRPIDGWKYMIEEIGPNAKRSEGSVSRLPSVSDESSQPFREEKTPVTTTFNTQRGR